ncbi:non-SMC mitotic condensation complex subunit 1-domain-containing protein [Collybia nuda]|uniref:Condensin complex subunit 1 n=1 Tax=Collybia nuda TaxID=64659 RepID=A0A9P5XU39_9AGAR|nr:non-SMC mitotic condensation complex subunit 1-domain-containing protein [Collybia nuda]
MTISFELQDEIQSLQDTEAYEIPHEHDPETEHPERLLEAAVEAVAESSDAIQDPEVFDVYRSLLKHSKHVPGTIMSKLLDSISSGLQIELDATMREVEQGDQQGYMEHKLPLEMYAFLLHWFVIAAEKVKASDDDEGAAPAPKARRGRGGKAGGRVNTRTTTNKKNESWTWDVQIPPTLALISKVLRLQTQRIWTTTAEREAFITCLTRPAYHITESEQYMKNEKIRMGVYKVICLAVKHHGHSLAVQITIMQSLQFYEHLSEPMAECLSVLAKEFDHAQLGDEILREIGAKVFNSQDPKGPRAFARFLVKFAELAPRSILKQLSLLLGQLDSESYPMRVAIVEVIGYLAAELASQAQLDDGSDRTQINKQINGLFDLLLERAMDVSSYVRTKVLSVLSKLCDLGFKFPKQRLAVTQVAVAALEDKAATVRKGAVALLVKLLLTHPYGKTHGGYLELEIWEGEYQTIKAELAKAEGTVGNAVRDNNEDDEDEDGDEEEEDNEDVDEEGGEDEQDESERPKKKKKRSKVKIEDEMDVDENEDEGEDKGDQGDDTEEDEPSMSVDGDGSQATPRKKSKKKRSKLGPRKSQINVAAVADEQTALAELDTNLILRLRLQKRYYAEALNFMRQIEGAMDIMGQLLGSTSKPEVLEAMEFFRVAYEYRFESAKIGIKKMIHLIWTKDNSTSTSEDGKEIKGVRSRLLECYRNLYFDPIPDPEMSAKDQVNRISKNMIELTYEATLAELTSLEEMMRILMDEGHVHQDIITRLWAVYKSERGLPKEQRQGAINLLGMLALAKRSVLTDHVDVMLKVGLGRLGRADLTLARYTCVALQRLNGSAKKIKGSLLDKTLRIKMDDPIFRKLQAAVEQPCRSKEWFGLAEQAINTIYALGEHPDALCNNLIKKFTIRAFSRDPKPNGESLPPVEKDPDAMEEDNPGDVAKGSDDTTAPPEATQEEQGKDVGDAFELSQLLFIVGHVAIKHIAHLELIEREWKRQKDEKQTAEKQAASANGNTTAKDAEELDQVAGNAEDEIGDRIAGVRETELLYGPESLLALYGPMIVHICGSPHKFKNRTLRAAATLSFSKFLCVSSQFCDQHHRLLFKILETSKDANIRSNIVIALGDVAVSFSSIIDENSNELYKGLSDKDLVVKKNTLMVLTHLILNGMIKVKGQLGEMAKCVEDPEPRIADLAKLFFKELSTKENAIYNNLPDVISHLSTGDHAVEEEIFQKVLKYIFTYIEKEKQAENIVEKLCQRFRLSEEPRQWRDIAYCLSLLPFKSDRSIKKLIEGLQFYRDKLHEPEVFERFSEILAKARANKSKDKQQDSDLDEFEKILEEHRLQGEEDDALEKRVGKKKAAAKKRATRRSARSKTQAPVEENDSE